MSFTKSLCGFMALVYLTTASPSPSSFGQTLACTAEQHRPRFHFSPKRNWINDPNGMVFYEGLYHLYYQHNPDSMVWGPMYWGHAISRNMAIWEEQEIALAPDELGTIFSGSAVVDYMNTTGFKQPNGLDPVVAIFTHDGNGQKQSIAYSLDNGFTFTKYEGNPVLNSSETNDFRDPKVSYQNDQWLMALAVFDRIEFYSSPDLKNWVKESEIGRNPLIGDHNGVWECPDLISLEVEVNGELRKMFVLFVSINPGAPNGGSGTQYFIGNLTNDGQMEFQTYPWSSSQWLDWGPDNYAGVTFSNEPNGRQIYMAWMTNWAYASDTPNLSHRGQMTIPRQIGIRVLNEAEQQYRIVSTPVSELSSLRHPLQSFEHNNEFEIVPQTTVEITEPANFKNSLMELDISLELKDNPQFSICAYNDVNEEVCFGYNGTQWYLDRSRSGNVDFNGNYHNLLYAQAVREVEDEITNIRIFLDVSSIEVFADGGLTTMTALHFPSQPFDKFYVNHWSSAVSLSTLTVKNYKIWGLQCWFNEVSV